MREFWIYINFYVTHDTHTYINRIPYKYTPLEIRSNSQVCTKEARINGTITQIEGTIMWVVRVYGQIITIGTLKKRFYN